MHPDERLFVTWREFVEMVPSKESIERLETTIAKVSERFEADRSRRTTITLALFANAITIGGLIVALFHH